jgi:hypothetical protein
MHEGSHGIPRTLNVIADNALVTAFATERRPVNTKVVLEVCADLDLQDGVKTISSTAPPPKVGLPSSPTRLITIDSGGAPSDAAAAPSGDRERGAWPQRRKFSLFRTAWIRGTE